MRYWGAFSHTFLSIFNFSILIFILSSTYRLGTTEERGLLYWKNMRASVEKSQSSKYLLERISATYDLPYVGDFLRRSRVFHYLPFCQTYSDRGSTEFSGCASKMCFCCLSRQNIDSKQNCITDNHWCIINLEKLISCIMFSHFFIFVCICWLGSIVRMVQELYWF